jgi:hypothetical protein
MFATDVEREDTRGRSVDRPDFTPKRPKYLDRSVWTDVHSVRPEGWEKATLIPPKISVFFRVLR